MMMMMMRELHGPGRFRASAIHTYDRGRQATPLCNEPWTTQVESCLQAHKESGTDKAQGIKRTMARPRACQLQNPPKHASILHSPTPRGTNHRTSTTTGQSQGNSMYAQRVVSAAHTRPHTHVNAQPHEQPPPPCILSTTAAATTSQQPHLTADLLPRLAKKTHPTTTPRATRR